MPATASRPRSIALITWTACLLGLGIILFILALHGSPAINHTLKKMDFTNYWTASKLLLDGRVLELFRGQSVYFAALNEYVDPDINWHNWSYPPHYLLFLIPLGLLNYLPAAVAFLFVTLFFFLHAVSAAEGRLRISTLTLLLPAIICNMAFMQNGFLTAALLIYGLSQRQTRPILAGIAIGMLTVKPQLGFLLPILLIVERRWCVILSAAATAASMIVLTLVAWGPEAWSGYFMINLPYQKDVMLHLVGIFTYMMPSVYGSLRAISVAPDIALQAHIPVAVLSLAAYLYCLKTARGDQARAVATVFATFMISPYSLIYDLGALSAMAAFAIATAADAGVTDRKGGLLWLSPLLLVCILPFLTLTFAIASVPISPLVIALAWFSAMTVSYRSGVPGQTSAA